MRAPLTSPKPWAILTLALLSCMACSDMAGPTVRRQAVERVTSFMRTGDTTNLGQAFSDSLLAQLSVGGMHATRAEWIADFGPLDSVGSPNFNPTGDVDLTLHFHQLALAVNLTFDSADKISFVSVAAVPERDASEEASSAFEATGAGLTELRSVGEYAPYFAADSGHVRLVALLSPT